MVKRQIPAGKFKATCLALLDEVQQSRQEILITKRGKPVARLVPVGEAPRDILGWMKGTGEITGDIISPIGEIWDAER